jgi:hypothetical protein
MDENKDLEQNYIWWDNDLPDTPQDTAKKDENGFLNSPKPYVFDKIKTGKPFAINRYVEDNLKKIS